MRSRTVAVAAMLIAAACGGGEVSTTSAAPPDEQTPSSTIAGSTTTTTDPGFEVTSEDGALSVRVPVEAMADDPGISIRLLTPAEYPEPVASAAQTDGAKIYELEPDGLVFDAPVRVTRRIPVEDFGPLTDTEVPLVALATQNAEGEFELLDSLYSMRDGDDIVVGGRTTHFSPVVSLYGRVHARLVPDEDHSVIGTESGTTFYADIEFYAPDGTPLNKPSMTDAWMRSRSDFIGYGDGTGRVEFSCKDVGVGTARFGYRVTFADDAPAEEAKPQGLSTLVPGLRSPEVLFKVAVPFECFDPKTSIVGRRIEWSVQSDHPAGEVVVPNEDFGGGVSAAAGTIGEGWGGAYIGLIKDTNGNEAVDYEDWMYQPIMAEVTGSFVNPLYSFGDYFLYVVDQNSYGSLPSWGPQPYSVFDGLSWLCGQHTGTGRFETSVGLLGMGGSAYQYTVDASEGRHDVEDEVLPFPVNFRLMF